MNAKRLLQLLASLAIAVLASACTQKNTGDQPDASTVPQGLNRFLLFPNPLSMNSGGFETNTTDYADAYYRAIDPGNLKDTIDKWKTQNGFGSGTGTELLAVFRDTRDLGYGRRMTGRRNTDGSIGFFVENYSVTPNASGDYSSILNVEAAIKRDTRWHVGTNAIEWSTTPCVPGVDPADCGTGAAAGARFAKFYNFSSKDGTRQVAVDLDGNGLKAMPGPCITCHGGRGDPLTPPDAGTGKPRFPLAENSVSRKRGDVQARLHGMNVGSFGFSPDLAGFSRTDQEATLKTFNQWILCTYPLSATSPSDPTVDACRVPAGANEWQGTAAELIKSWYGGTGTNGMPNPTFADNYVPLNWQAATAGAPAEDVYKNVVAPFCRTCHILRGTKNQDDINFMMPGAPAVGPTPATGFTSYADRIKAHVFDRGTMPLAKIVYNDFWNSGAPTLLANFINPSLAALVPPLPPATDFSGAALRPGRPIASPGPDRMVRTGSNATLTGEDSLFASSFNWSMVSGSATITDPNSMITIFNAPAPGDYKVRLTVGNGTQTHSKDITITASDTFPDSGSIRFAHVKNVLQNLAHITSQVPNPGKKCVDCHFSGATSPIPPIFYNSGFDRNGDATVNTTDEDWFLKSLIGRINLTEIEASPLLRKPSGNHHNGLMLLDVADKSDGGGLSNYSILYNWILAGAPPGGVAANMAISSGVGQTSPTSFTFTFSGPLGGPYISPNITLAGGASLGATTFAWTVFGPPGPLGDLPVITNPTAATATLNVFNVGTYVVQLQVSDGVSTDTVQRTIVVGENPISASFAPATGTAQVTFSGSPLRGPITLNAVGSAGSPITCRWQVIGPDGGTLGAFGTSVDDQTQLCANTATLTVPSTTIGSSYTVQLTASTLASSTVANFIVIAPAPGSSPSNPNFTIPAASIGFSIGTTPGATPTPSITGITLTASANGVAPLSFSWTAAAGSANCSIAAGSSTVATKTLNFTRAGTCDVTLTVSNGILPNASITKTVTINSTVVFSQVAAIFGNAGSASPGVNANCISCHNGTNATPSWINDGGLFGRLTNQNSLNGPIVINFTTPQSSRILTCPNQGNCGMVAYLGFTGANFNNYNAILTWILNGTP